MTYVGRGLDAISNVEKLTNITFDGSTTYNLVKDGVAFTPSGANNILISIDGVVQSGNFSISNSQIIFDWSPTSNNTCNWVQHIGVGVLNVPADGTITASKMADNSIDSDSYVDGSIDAVHMSANSIDSASYVDGSIDEVHMSANSIDSDSYVDASIDTAHIGATQVTGAKLNNDVISAQTNLSSEPADTDEFMVSDGGVLKRIDYSLIKGGGITVADQWRITTSFDGTVQPITANWEQTDGTAQNNMGTSMAVSSGVWTFPSTGFYLVSFGTNAQHDADLRYAYSIIDATVNNSSYVDLAYGWGHVKAISEGVWFNTYCQTIVDVTNTTNVKVRFGVNTVVSGLTWVGDSSSNYTYATFIRLGDT